MISEFLTDDEYNRGTVLIVLSVWQRLNIINIQKQLLKISSLKLSVARNFPYSQFHSTSLLI
jgi:hypothetical protein